tara:strand:- start:213 stop:863 length:651 start_codon:yes stop_codon:yes gene_type:complete
MSSKTTITDLKNNKGIYGLGFSLNENLDLLNLVVLAFSGIIIKLFFQENYSKLGNIGPASTTIWGYGLTGLAIFLMIFMNLYLKDVRFIENYINFGNIKGSIPIFLTLCIIVYIIILNFSYYIRINSNVVSDSYHTYSFFSSLLLVLQISLITKYMYNQLQANFKNNIMPEMPEMPDEKNMKQSTLIENLLYILSLVNFIFVLIIHILLAFFSTDG